MCGKLVVLVLSAGPLFAAAAFRQTAPPTLAGVFRDEPGAVVHHVTAAARTFSGDQRGQRTNANPGGDAIANLASEFSPRTSYTRKITAKGGGFIPASAGNVAPGFCTTSDLVAFRPFGADEFRSAPFELRRSDAVDARNFFAAAANCLERNRTAFTNKISISAMRSRSGIVHCSNPVATGIAGVSRMGGLQGWQWLHLLEGAPAVLAGIVFMSLLADNPDQGSWLPALEKRLLRARMAEKQTSLSEGRRLSMLLDAFRSSGQSGLLGAIPWTSGSIAMPTIARHSDATTERRWHVLVIGVAGSAAFAASAIPGVPGWVALPAPTVAAAGVPGAVSIFWRLPTAILSSTAAAAGIAWINPVGNGAGYVTPFPNGRRSISGMT